MSNDPQTSDTTGVGQDPSTDPDGDPQYVPGGSAEPEPEPEAPGGTAAMQHPPATE